MQRRLLILCMLYLGLIAGSPGYGQCTVQHAYYPSIVRTSPEGNNGQSFTATCSGTLNSVGFIQSGPSTVSGMTVKVYAGEGTGGTLLGTVGSVTFTPSNPAKTGWKIVDMSSQEISVESGNVYTVIVENSNRLFTQSSSSYSGGKSYWNGTGYNSSDLFFKVEISAANIPPTAAGFTANPKEGVVYAFKTSDFGYGDIDSDPLDHITVTAPASGTLFIDSNDNDTGDVGEGVADAVNVSKADLDAGWLKYLSDGGTSSSFTFKVNDGSTYSEMYTATLTVNPLPTASISSTSTNPTKDNPIPVTISFSEAVTGFTVDDLVLSNASASNFTGSDDSYTIDLTPSAEGEITLDIAGGVAIGSSGRDNKAASQFSIIYDITPPIAVMSTEQTNPTNVSTFTVKIKPGEAINGLNDDDLQVSNGSLASFSTPGISYIQTIGTGVSGSGDNQLNFPYDVSVGPEGKIYVADRLNHRIQVFNADYSYHATIGTGTQGSGNDQFNNPFGIAVASDGNIYVADFGNHRVQVFNPDYTYHTTIGVTGNVGSGNDTFNKPFCVAIASDGKIYVADSDNYRIQVFSDDYSYLATIGTGTQGSGDDQFNSPAGVSVGPDGKIYVADDFNHRIQVFNDDYSYHATIGTGTEGSGNDQFNNPRRVSVSSDGMVYIADESNHRIQVFNPDYSYHTTIGTGTSGSGNDQLELPYGIFFASDGKLYITDTHNHRIQVFESLNDYQAKITATAEGEVGIEIAEGAFSDEAGNASTEGASFSITYDVTSPTVSISSEEVKFTNQSPFLATFTFSEEVQDFTAEDISVTNGSAANLQSSDNISYTVEITPAGDGEVSVSLGAELAEDLAGNLSEASNTLSLTYDGTAPTVSISSAEQEATEQKSFEVTFTFSEVVSGFSAEDMSLENATLGDMSSSDDKIFTATLTAVSGGTVSVSLAEGQATDAAGNGNVASEVPLSIIFDQAPVITADQSFEISQISPEGSLLGRIAATDVTEETTLQDWTMVSVTEGEATAEGIFTIDATTGEISVSQSGGLGNASRDFVLTLTVSDGAKVSKPAQVTISYRPVNQAPGFVKGEDISLLPGAADYRYAGWASQVSAGPSGEAGQQLSFVLSNDQPDFFTSQPVISSNGELSFSLADNVSGTVTVTATLQDDGGTANGGVDSSEPVTFTIVVSKIPQLITFAPLADKMVGQDPIVLAAEGGDSGEPVTFSISTEPAEGVARLEGNRVIIDDVGEVTVTATQAGNDTYQEAEPVVRRFSITTNALFLPSAFTPNEDGFNDRFILRGGGGVASVEFSIMDRSRNIVYRSTDWEAITSEGWDGSYQGKMQPLGIYIWRLKGSYRNGQPLEVEGKTSGTISLIR